MIDWNKPIEVYEKGQWHSAEFVAEDKTDVCFRLNGALRLWDKDDEDIRNTPPAPCEPAPAPDSVEIAKKMAADKIYDDDFRSLLRAYAAEQTAQRKAAGELERACGGYISNFYADIFAALAADASARAGKGEVNNEYSKLQDANRARHVEWWNGTAAPSLSFRGNELAGEVGEACNVIKKLERERLGMRGSRATVEQLGDELADTVICAYLVAMDAGVDLDAAIVRKFNATSEKYGLQTRMLP